MVGVVVMTWYSVANWKDPISLYTILFHSTLADSLILTWANCRLRTQFCSTGWNSTKGESEARIACNNRTMVRWQKILLLLLLTALFLLLARIGARHYFRETAIRPGTFPVMIGRVFALWALTRCCLQPLLAMRSLNRLFGLDKAYACIAWQVSSV
ncbi:hypothetical protein MASR1M12_10570 [Erysipelotrichia bacterium]